MLKGEGDDDTDPAEAGASFSQADGVSPVVPVVEKQLTKEELRKKRLGGNGCISFHRVNASLSSSSSTEKLNKMQVSTPNSSSANSRTTSSLPVSAGGTTTPPLPLSESANKEVGAYSSPVSATKIGGGLSVGESLKMTVDTTNSSNDNGNDNDKSGAIASAPNTPARDSRPTTPASVAISTPGTCGLSTPARHARALNNHLESVFLFTSRREAAGVIDISSGQPLIYVGGDVNADDTAAFLNSSTLTENVGSRLSMEGLGSNTVNYLIGAYKRIISKETHIHVDIRDEFMSCKSQCISFLATSLQNPDMFGDNSVNSCSDLLIILGEDASPSINILVRDLAAELSEQNVLKETVDDLLKLCYDLLNVAYDAAMRSNPMQMLMGALGPTVHSIMDDISRPLTALCSLSRDKRIASLMTQASMFRLDEAAAAPVAANAGVFSFASTGSSGGAVKGAALAKSTLLGRLLRNAVEPRDSQFALLFKDLHRMTRSQMEGNTNQVRQRITSLVNGVHGIIKAMLQSGATGKENALSWLMQSVSLNAELEKDQPSHTKGASRGFMLNVLSVLLQLCSPFTMVEDKLKKVDVQYLFDPECISFMPRGASPLMEVSTSSQAPVPAASASPANFMTQCFFLTVRAIHLSYSPWCREYERLLQHLNRMGEEIQSGEPRALQLFTMKLGMDCELNHPNLITELVNFGTALSSVLLSALTENFGPDSSASILSEEQLSIEQVRIMSVVPEYVLDDLMTVLTFIAKNRADLLNIPQMSYVLELTIFFLRRPSAVRSPHVRAKFAEVLYQVFMPNSERETAHGWDGRYSPQKYPDGISSRIVESNVAAQNHLAPTLLLLYGDVERTGFYEKLGHRRRISAILKHLWNLPAHRSAFRGIATSDQVPASNADTTSAAPGVETVPVFARDGTSFFIRFANGLLNETNKLVSDTLTALGDIKSYQTLITTQEWANMSADARKDIDDKQKENENIAKHSASLCLETVHMVNYLTSDPVIQKPFLQKEILPRFVSMILNVIHSLSGTKSLAFKVNNMESYDFRPKEMLQEVCQALSHVCTSEEFQQAAVTDAFFEKGVPLTKAIVVIRKHFLLKPADIQKIETFRDQAYLLALDADEMDKLFEDPPERYLDPLLLTLMSDPVLLPTSGNIVERSCIMQHLLNDQNDPFNRAPLTQEDLVPSVDLKKEIDEWKEERKRSKIEAAGVTTATATPTGTPPPEEVTVSGAAFTATATSGVATNADTKWEGDDEDAEMAAAIALSLKEDN